jgi:hypothetical protein
MVNEHFQKGRECQQLETQVTALHIEILCTESDEQRARLRAILQEAYKSYAVIAKQYGIPMWEFAQVSQTYDRAMGNDQTPRPTSVQQEDSPF